MSIERELRNNWDSVYYPEPEPMVEQQMPVGQQPGDVLVAEAGSRNLPPSAYSGETRTGMIMSDTGGGAAIGFRQPMPRRSTGGDLEVPMNPFARVVSKGANWFGDLVDKGASLYDTMQLIIPGGFDPDAKMNLPTDFKPRPSQIDPATGQMIPATMGFNPKEVTVGEVLKNIPVSEVIGVRGLARLAESLGTGNLPAFGDLLDTAGLWPVGAMGPEVIKATIGTAKNIGRELAPKAGEMAIKSMEKLGTPVQMNIVEPAAAMATNVPTEITRQEKSAITTAAKRNPTLRESATNAVNDFHKNYSIDDGWTPVEVNKITFKQTKTGEKIPEIETNVIPYDFHTPPEGVPKEAWQATLSNRIVDEVQSIVERANSGDQAAKNILAEAGWYRAMRDQLRSEFGGIGDVFADILGTTSAQTDVRQNFKNAVAILSKFSRGDYDNALAAYEKRVKAGQSVDPGTLNQLYKSGEFDLIKSDAGALFNTNSPASMGALLDMFRAVKAGDSPKTPNFTGNLIGLTNEATIDVWAARLLRRMADLPRIPPPAEKGVAGKHLKGSTLYQPNVGSEFGFGQDVFREAASEINNSGIVKSFDPQIGDLGPDDLQAIAWFIEKENWTKNGWTSKAGEGGSLDYEMSLAGSADQKRIDELRQGINAGFQPPAMRVGEKREMRDTLPQDQNLVGPPIPPFVGPSTYPGRLEKARQEDIANKIAMRQELESMKAPLERYQLGVSGERPGKPMSNYGQAELAAEFDDVVRNDSNMVAYNLASTYGSFMGSTERALNAEFVVRKDFSPIALETRLIEQGKAYDQDAVFISKVVKDGTTPNARPGVEIYFKQKITPEEMAKVTERLRQYGVDGFTYVTDMRFSDKINVQAKAGAAETAGLNGIRFQYIPEFDDTYKASNRVQTMKQKQDLFQDIVDDIIKDGNVSDARLVYYDTKVHFRSDYDVYLARTTGATNQSQGGGLSSSTNATQSNSSGEVGKEFSRAVSNRLRKKTTKSNASVNKDQSLDGGNE